ncbi:DUF4082 domain-containing protein [Chroococcus sp. FPU101]|uniref:DUF4082 domain-containing protein n=1 Tax=Chroococcus sp. FPU101 TaxID=1974212 RepID=UPI001AA3EFEE|nr:DUF4082 domain-containing protein [Chroococcus sp. FPU101]GFE68211.1 hypothetical protein CFPU101_08210 [Chroococcus sp. FPU101]
MFNSLNSSTREQTDSYFAPPRTLAFVDTNVSDINTILASLNTDVKVLLDASRDGITQITETLHYYQNLTSVVIISHGNTAELQLGSSHLTSDSLQQYHSDLQQWSTALTSDADLLFFGCNVADQEAGQNFIQQISTLTGTDVAASTNLTGETHQGGDWTLEYSIGSIETIQPFISSLIDNYQGLLNTTLFAPTATPSLTNLTDGVGYELGMEFSSVRGGQIEAIRFWKAPSETGTHAGKIWSTSGELLASTTFTNETASGWQEQDLSTLLNINANTTYIVSVNINTYYAATPSGLTNVISSGELRTIADGSNGVFGDPNTLPIQSFNNTNYFRDIVFIPEPPPTENNLGTVTIAGTVQEDQTLTATVDDVDGLSGVTINYQWQQLNNSTWSNITGATQQTYTLDDAQVNKSVRVKATYIDLLGSSENITSDPTTVVSNTNDLGIVGITGRTSQGNTLTATVSDNDGLSGVTINYQWQKLNNGDWVDLAGVTSRTLTLTSSLVGEIIRVRADYTDALGSSENIFSEATNPIAISLQTLFAANQTPSQTTLSDGSSYELGMEFKSVKVGQIQAIRFWKSPNETGTHIGKIWSTSGTLLASVAFENETASGWQEQLLTNPLTIQANTTYIVSVNSNNRYAATQNGLANVISRGDLRTIADGSNGVFGDSNTLPTQSFRNTNYFRDVVFAVNEAPGNNNPGTVTISGAAQERETLTATVVDLEGAGGTIINYQWQQLDNGIWSNIDGATSQTLTLSAAQVNKAVRVQVSYTDDLNNDETAISDPTSLVSNVNDLGVITVSGKTAQNNTLMATVSDIDGLAGVTINYQWQKLQDGTWIDLTGATNRTLTLDSTVVGQFVRVSANYTDAQGGNETIFSEPTNPIAISLQNVFAAQTPNSIDLSDGSVYELGMEFRSVRAGQIQAIRFWKSPSEIGSHTGKIWSTSGVLLASVTFENESASGWQEQDLEVPLNIKANTTYIVSVNSNGYYVATSRGLASVISRGDLRTVADGSNGVFGQINKRPTQSFENTNYFRDVVFAVVPPPANNNLGTVTITGTVREDQTLSAIVGDADGLSDVTINYQWQQFDNGNWTDIERATGETLTLGDAQVNKLLRVMVNYVDEQGNSEELISVATPLVINVNDPGSISINGRREQGNILIGLVEDNDGLSGIETIVTIDYQWQQLINGTWTNIIGATTASIELNSSFVGQQIRLRADYTDTLGTNETLFSNPTIPIVAHLDTFFTPALTPTQTNLNDGNAYELGMEFTSLRSGQIHGIRFWKAANEIGTHIGKIWSTSGTLLASVTFINETPSGWQEQILETPLNIQANTTYIVSVNSNRSYVAISNGLGNSIISGDFRTIADNSNGVYGQPNTLPTQSFKNSNYFRDIIFVVNPPPVNNNPGTATVSGIVEENRTLTATVTDTDGLSNVTINYQWQQLDNGTWSDIDEENRKTLVLGDEQVNKSVRVRVSYIDVLGSSEDVFSADTIAVTNINDPGATLLSGSAVSGQTLKANVIDDDGITNVTITYQWQVFNNNTWSNLSGASAQMLTINSSLLDKQVRAITTYTDAHGTSENALTKEVTIAAQNQIVLENQQPGTRNWEITDLADNNEIAGYASATSVNKGGYLPLKVSLKQLGKYRIDIYRLGYYGGDGGRFIVSSGELDGVTQSGPTTDPTTKLVEYKWNTSYNVLVGNDWTSGLYIAKLTEISSNKQSQIWFAVRDDERPADIGFQASFTTYQAYNNYGGYSLYNANSSGEQRAFAVSFDRPMAPTHLGTVNNDGYNVNNMLAWEYHKVRWLESQGYDISYYTNLDVAVNPLQLYSQRTFLSAGHDEYWSMEMRDHVEQARDRGTNLAFFSSNTAYWRVRFEPSSSGEANRVMVCYKQSWGLDPVAQNDVSQATTTFRSSEVNRPENALMGIMYTGNTFGGTQGFDFIPINPSDPYYNGCCPECGPLRGLVGYEWDSVVNNGFTPPGLVVLGQSNVIPTDDLPDLPSGTNVTVANAVRFTTASGARVFSIGSNHWVWGLDSDRLNDPRTDPRAQQFAVNIFADMGAIPMTPSAGIIIP